MKQKEVKYVLALQLFANPNTQTTTAEGLSDEMKTFYNDTLIDLAGPKLVYDQFADKYPIPKNGGKSIEFRKYDNLSPALTPLTEGVTPDGNKLNVTTITATVDQFGDYITLSDMLILTAVDNNVTQATKRLGEQAGKTGDCITRDVVCGGSNVYFPNGKTSRGSLTEDDKLTLALVMEGAAFLRTMDAPTIDGDYVCILHPQVEKDLKLDPEWKECVKYDASERIFEGEIGRYDGVRFVSSSNAKIWKSDEDDCPDGLGVFGTMLVGAGAYATTQVEGGGLQVIVKQLGSGDDPLNQRATVGWKLTKVAERLVEQYMLRFETCSSWSASATAN